MILAIHHHAAQILSVSKDNVPVCLNSMEIHILVVVQNV